MIRTNFQWGELYRIAHDAEHFTDLNAILPGYVPIWWMNHLDVKIWGPPAWKHVADRAWKFFYRIDWFLFHLIWKRVISEGERLPFYSIGVFSDFLWWVANDLWVQKIDYEVERPSDRHLTHLSRHVTCYGCGNPGHPVETRRSLWLIVTHSGRPNGWCCGPCLDEGRLDVAARFATWNRVRGGY